MTIFGLQSQTKSNLQGYGLTESCACGTIMDSDDNSIGTAGPPLQGVQIQLINWDEGNYTVDDQPNPRGL